MSTKISTIYDVAQKAGISIATVSRVINTPEKVSHKTKEKVFNVMKQLNFIPKADARARAKKDTGRIGVITLNMTYPSFSHRLRGISKTLEETPFELIIITVKNMEDINYYLRSTTLTDKLDGLIILSHKFSKHTLTLLEELNIKTVFIEFGEENFTSVVIDNYKGGQMVADFLISKGYNHFSILTEKENRKNVLPNQLRVSGFINRLKENSRSIKNDKIFYTNEELESGIKTAELILKSKNRPEVIFATTDLLAVCVIKVAKQLNISIPKELGVIGFDGTNISDYMDITTVDQSLEESGSLAAQLLIKSIKTDSSSINKVLLPLKIIERKTIK